MRVPVRESVRPDLISTERGRSFMEAPFSTSLWNQPCLRVNQYCGLAAALIVQSLTAQEPQLRAGYTRAQPWTGAPAVRERMSAIMARHQQAPRKPRARRFPR